MVTNLSSSDLIKKIRAGKILLAGNRKLKIYGTLKCRSGKRMRSENRIFFEKESDAVKQGFRPCAHCMKNEYRQWKTAKNGLSPTV